jgi:predicted DNA-binding ribbon-helix-helix protein
VSDKAAQPGDVEGQPDQRPIPDLAPEFRVVVHSGQRRGIRLEHGFWEALKAIAAQRKCTLGALVGEIAAAAGDGTNLSSALRVACLRYANLESSSLRRLASIETVRTILLACPAPAFALENSRKILTFNPPFQNLVRRQLPAGLNDDSRHELKLALDLNIPEILERLRLNGNLPVASGFVIGVGERRYRGLINTARAPVTGPELLMAFVVNG